MSARDGRMATRHDHQGARRSRYRDRSFLPSSTRAWEMYFTGIGVLRDSTEAVRWYRLAAVHLRREILMAGEGVKGIKGWVLHYIIGSIPLLMVYSSGVD